MNKLSKKFIWGIIIILSLSCLCSILFHTKFLEKYYLFQKRNTITSIAEKLADSISHGNSPEDVIHQMESANKVIIVKIDSGADVDNETVNDEIRNAFQTKGIGFQKYWLWEEDYEKILDGETRLRLYKQENLNYSLLVKYVQIDSELFAVTMIIPNIADAFGIIKQFLMIVNVVSILVSILFLIVFIKRITKPLEEFKKFATHMKNNEFIPLEVHTKDELESVSDSLNLMGSQMIAYQNSLKEKNEEMEQLLDNVAHDLKTPISLIELYASGIKDGLDDGTFLDTIEAESKHMAEMVEKLLYVSRITKGELELRELNLSVLLSDLIEEGSTLAKSEGIVFSTEIEDGIFITSSYEMIKSLFTNLITNAVKYASSSRIDVTLRKKASKIIFSIANQTDNRELDLIKIWTPYYVGEQSRNKKLSGTGLGLTIAHKVCEKLQYAIGCSMEEKRIVFVVTIPELADFNRTEGEG